MNKTDIIFSENCWRYVIRFSFLNVSHMTETSFLRELGEHVHSTINIWGAKTFFSKKEAKEVLTACNAIWPEGHGHICKVYMSAPVIEEEIEAA